MAKGSGARKLDANQTQLIGNALLRRIEGNGGKIPQRTLDAFFERGSAIPDELGARLRNAADLRPTIDAKTEEALAKTHKQIGDTFEQIAKAQRETGNHEAMVRNLMNAGRRYESASEFKLAAEAFEEAGEHVMASETLALGGFFEEAFAMLGKMKEIN